MQRESPYRVAIANANVPNMLGQISTAMAGAGLNIHTMVNKSRGEVAYTLVDVDSPISPVCDQRHRRHRWCTVGADDSGRNRRVAGYARRRATPVAVARRCGLVYVRPELIGTSQNGREQRWSAPQTEEAAMNVSAQKLRGAMASLPCIR